MAPDLNLPSANSLKVGGGGESSAPSAKQPASKSSHAPAAPCQKDFWGNCSQPTVALLPSLIAPTPPPPPPAQQPPPKGSKATAAPCEKDFWGSCKQPAPALLPPSIIPSGLPSIIAPAPPSPASPSDKKAADNQAEPCQKDFWGNCTQMIPTVHSSPAKAPPQEGQGAGPKAECVRDFWGNCTPVANNRHAYRWRYVRPGHRSTMATTPTPPVPLPSGGGGGERSGGRVESAGPPVVCHPKRRVIGEEQPSTEQAQLSAEQAWMGSVRYDFGERYQNLAMAKDVRYTCSPSSAKSGLKRAMYRCATEAVPCRTAGN